VGRFLLLCAALLLLSAVATSFASAATTWYLRPNVDVSRGSWSTVGATSGWDALNDGVTELQTPSSPDYATTTAASTKLRIGVVTAPLGGNKILGASAWIYTPNAARLSFRASSSGSWTTVSSAGWHSAPVPLNGRQTQLDDLILEVDSSSGTAARVVRAAFLKVIVEPKGPKVYWGARMDGDARLLKEPPEAAGGDAPWSTTTWNEFEANAGGKKVSIVHFGQPPPWQQDFEPAPFELTMNRGAIPLLSMGTTGATLSELAYSSVSSSVPLQKFTKWAEAVHSFGHPFFLRLDWEMNLVSSADFPWVNEARKSPATFVAAWQRLHNIAVQKGATNITWVWCPNASYSGSTSLKALFPGRAYVDWTCIDRYNRGDYPAWASFSGLFATTYNEILALTEPSVSPPMMIGETASIESGETAKARWIAEALGTEIPNSFPKLKAFVWFNWNIYDGAIGDRWEWPIETSAASRRSFALGISSSYYAGANFKSLPLLKPVPPLP
jgi:hypothetical protein